MATVRIEFRGTCMRVIGWMFLLDEQQPIYVINVFVSVGGVRNFLIGMNLRLGKFLDFLIFLVKRYVRFLEDYWLITI